jgi:cell division transport system permease protein
MFTSLRRISKSAWHGFTRDGSLVFANLFIMAMVIALVSGLFLFRKVSDVVIDDLQNKVDVSVYFKYETQEDDILEAKDKVAEVPEVKSVEYVSKEDALASFTERHQDEPALMESLAEVGINPFLAALNIRSFQASQYEAVASFLESSDFSSSIEKIDYHERKPVIERIFALTSNINLAGIIFSLFMALVAMLVAYNTVRLSIYNSKDEIKIQRLVGASNWFIRGPFLVQGIIVGFFSALACLAIFSLLSWGLNSSLNNFISTLNVFDLFVANVWMIISIQLLTGIGLGILSGLIAIRRYLEA